MPPRRSAAVPAAVPAAVLAVALGAGLALLGAACADLPIVPRGVCGNGIVEPGAGEECDLVAGHAGGVCRQPGEAFECRHDCSAAASGDAPPCGAGQRCGVDGVCREPSGRFAPARDLVAASPIELLGVDLDGDRRDDIVSFEERTAEVHFLGEAGGIDERRSIPSRRAVGAFPHSIRFGPTEPESLLVPFAGSALFALGGADRALPMTGHALTLDTVVAMRLGTVQFFTAEGPEQTTVAAADLGTLMGMVIVRTDYSYALVGALPRSPEELVDLPAAELIEDPSRPCEELLLAYRGASVVDALSPCAVDPNGRPVAAAAVAAPLVSIGAGASLTGPLWLGDLDGDGHRDVALVAEAAGARELHVAYGDGTGAFSGAPGGPKTGVTAVAQRLAPGVTPLCLGDVDRDGAIDYADASGVVLARAPAPVRAPTSGAVAWGLARFGDVNGDGLVDAIGASTAGSVLDVLLGTGLGSFSNGAVDVPTQPSAIELADLDGDFVTDIAILTDGERAGESVLSVAFGDAGSFPTAAAHLGVLDEVSQLYGRESTVPVPARGLSVISRAPGGALQLTAFVSSADRIVRAPVPLLGSASEDPLEFELEAYLASRFAIVRSGSSQAVAALGEEFATPGLLRLFALPLTGRGRIDMQRATSTAYLPSGPRWASGFLTAIDLEPDARDELAILAPIEGEARSQLQVARSAGGDSGPLEFALEPPVALELIVDHQEAAIVAPGSPQGGRALAVDLDGDGLDDLAFSASLADGTPVVAVAWNDGGFARVTSAALGAPADGLAAFGEGSRGGRALAVLTGGSLSRLTGRARELRLEPLVGGAASGATLLASGDFDGDGVDDFVVGDATRLRLVRGIPALE